MNEYLTVIIPVYNEAENIEAEIKSIEECVDGKFLIYIVYDFDTDNTLPIVKSLQKTYDNIVLIKNQFGSGVANALKTGLNSVKTELAVVKMGDLSDSSKDINKMVKKAEETNADIVCASRYMKGGKQKGSPFVKGLMSKFAGLSLYYFAKIPTHDSTNSFKLYRKSFLDNHKIESKDGFETGLELVVKAHINHNIISEIPTVWENRISGKSNFKILKWLPSYLKWYFKAFCG